MEPCAALVKRGELLEELLELPESDFPWANCLTVAECGREEPPRCVGSSAALAGEDAANKLLLRELGLWSRRARGDSAL